jgi:outer membrane protein
MSRPETFRALLAYGSEDVIQPKPKAMMMIRAAALSLAALALALPAPGHAQEQPDVPTSLSLADAVEIARTYNPTLRQVANDLVGSAWNVRNAYASFVPGVNVNGSVGYRGAGSQTFLTEAFVQQSSTIGSSYGISLSMQVSGRTLYQPGLASAQHRAAQANLTGADINLESMVRQQYLAVLEAEAQVGLAESQVTRNDEFLRLAQARYDVGQNTLLDVRQAQVAKGESEVALLRARQGVIVEKLRLYEIMGVPAPSDLSALVLVDSFPVTEPLWALEDLLDEALADNPGLIVRRAQHSAARAGERAAKSTWLPTLSLSAGWSGYTQQYRNVDPLISNAQASAIQSISQCEYVNDYLVNPGGPLADCSSLAFTPADADRIRAQNDVFPFNFTSQPFSANLSISLPVFTQFRRPLEIAEASAATEDAEESVRALELTVRTDVSQAYYGLQASYEAIGIQADNRVAAAEQLRLATERYRVGSGTFFELLDAQLAAQRADADYIGAIYAYHRSIATLENAVGRPLR